jgi:2-hydroxy-3-keto-5-methylthiopentenyl-1-phosphate phosphatase
MSQALPQAAAVISEHDVNLLVIGSGTGVYIAFVVLLLLTVVDDARISRRNRASANAAAVKD